MKIYTYEGKANISGDRIHQARTAQRMSQDALAAKLQLAGLSIGREAVSRIETGLRFVTDYELVIFARVLGVTIEWLTADIVQCEECGAIKAFCAKHETYGYKCSECGHETPLEKLRPLFMHCKCGKSFSYKTNLTADRVTHTCLACKAPVDLELNSRKTAYVTVGERR